MNKKVFSASNWFVKSISEEEKSHSSFIKDRTPINELINSPLSNFDKVTEENKKIESELSKFFVPGWKGESLISKEVKNFVKILESFHKDAKRTFKTKDKFSRRIKISIYDEFLSFADYKSFNCTDLDHYSSFWMEIENSNSKYKKELDLFVEIFSFRIAVIYLLKVRFIITLLEQTNLKFDVKNIYYPNSFLSKVFKSGSSTELKSKAFEQNVFSWYRPSEKLKDNLTLFKSVNQNLSITEIIKTISITSEKILQEETDYSHSLSHKNFGLFLNSLLINFPIWKSTLNKTTPHNSNHDELEIISCKFAGDYLESMGLSHWLAQDANKNVKWDQILCPDFKKFDFETGQYLKVLNELQFLTFLAQIANIQGKEPKKFISKIVNSHLYNRKESNDIQKSLLLNDNVENDSTYDRIILNINNFPKNNPQHFLFNKIQTQKEYLKETGFIYIITSKKIFIPSQKSKVESLLNDFKVEGIFNFEGVSGKGKLGSYIYILSKKREVLFKEFEEKKQSCLNFRYFANLNSFHYFYNLTDLTQDFFKKNIGDLPPLYQKSCGDYRLEFNQDAILDGQLIHSSSKDSTKITHPLFFKRLMSLCNSFEYFFDLQNIEFKDSVSSYEEDENGFFGMRSNFQREVSPYSIIVDQRQKSDIRIEIISTSSLESKAYDYGHALCSYFYAYPKWSHLNIEAIREFFNSAVGKQVINLTFSNEVRKVKGNLSKLLIPRFFTNQSSLPEHLIHGLSFLKHNQEQILSTHPTELENQFNQINSILPTLVKTYPNEVLQYLCEFKKTISNAIEFIGKTNSRSKLNFNNPILKSPLLMSKTVPIYPDNKEIYIEFNSEAMNLMHSPLSKVVKKTVEDNGIKSYVLNVFAEDKVVISLYSEAEMILFLDFISNGLVGTPISKILQGISVPSNSDLKGIIESFESIHRTLDSIHNQITKVYGQLMNNILFKES